MNRSDVVREQVVDTVLANPTKGGNSLLKNLTATMGGAAALALVGGCSLPEDSKVQGDSEHIASVAQAVTPFSNAPKPIPGMIKKSQNPNGYDVLISQLFHPVVYPANQYTLRGVTYRFNGKKQAFTMDYFLDTDTFGAMVNDVNINAGTNNVSSSVSCGGGYYFRINDIDGKSDKIERCDTFGNNCAPLLDNPNSPHGIININSDFTTVVSLACDLDHNRLYASSNRVDPNHARIYASVIPALVNPTDWDWRDTNCTPANKDSYSITIDEGDGTVNGTIYTDVYDTLANPTIGLYYAPKTVDGLCAAAVTNINNAGGYPFNQGGHKLGYISVQTEEFKQLGSLMTFDDDNGNGDAVLYYDRNFNGGGGAGGAGGSGGMGGMGNMDGGVDADAGMDAQPDSPADAQPDSSADAGSDAAVDANQEGGTDDGGSPLDSQCANKVEMFASLHGLTPYPNCFLNPNSCKDTAVTYTCQVVCIPSGPTGKNGTETVILASGDADCNVRFAVGPNGNDSIWESVWQGPLVVRTDANGGFSTAFAGAKYSREQHITGKPFHHSDTIGIYGSRETVLDTEGSEKTISAESVPGSSNSKLTVTLGNGIGINHDVNWIMTEDGKLLTPPNPKGSWSGVTFTMEVAPKPNENPEEKKLNIDKFDVVKGASSDHTDVITKVGDSNNCNCSDVGEVNGFLNPQFAAWMTLAGIAAARSRRKVNNK